MDELYSIDELKLTGNRVVSTSDFPRVKMQKRRIDTYSTEYSVSGLAPLNHEALGQLLAEPLDIHDPSIPEVRKGLSDMSYPSRHIRLLAKRAGIAGYLEAIKSPVGELAAVMASATNESFASTSLPVFSYGEAREYVFDQLKGMEFNALLRDLRGFGLSPQAKTWFELMASTGDTPDGSFDEVFGDRTKRLELLKMVLLTAKSDPDDRLIVDFIDHQQDQWFTGFTNRHSYTVNDTPASGIEKTVYMRTEDAPVGASETTTVAIGPEQDLPHKKTGLPQRKVHFYNEQQELFASRRLSWVYDRRTGERSALLRSADIEPIHSRVLRPSEFAGLAAAAIRFGEAIDYAGALDEVTSKAGYRFRHLSRAGLWPLVATHNQEQIFSAPYFKLTEQKLDY